MTSKSEVSDMCYSVLAKLSMNNVCVQMLLKNAVGVNVCVSKPDLLSIACSPVVLYTALQLFFVTRALHIFLSI